MTLQEAYAYLQLHGPALGGRAMGGDACAVSLLNAYNVHRANPGSGVLEELFVQKADNWFVHVAADAELAMFRPAIEEPVVEPLRTDLIHYQPGNGYPLCGAQGASTMTSDLAGTTCSDCDAKGQKLNGNDDEAGTTASAQSGGVVDRPTGDSNDLLAGDVADRSDAGGVQDVAPASPSGDHATHDAAGDTAATVDPGEPGQREEDGQAPDHRVPAQEALGSITDGEADSQVGIAAAAEGVSEVSFPLEAPSLRTYPEDREWPYAFNHLAHAKCGECPLAAKCATTECTAQMPARFNGIMIVGEGPGMTEARLKKPFVGPAGALLDTILGQAGITRDECYITYATLCTSNAYGKAKQTESAAAVPACRPRLLSEVAHVRPRIIVPLGQVALNALTGHLLEKNKREPYTCGTCNGIRTWKRWACAKKGCKKVFGDIPFTDKDTKPEGAPCLRGCGLGGKEVTDEQVAQRVAVLEQDGAYHTPDAREGVAQRLQVAVDTEAREKMLVLCETKPKKAPKFQPRTIKCPECHGLKTKVVTSYEFRSSLRVGGKHPVTGAVIPASTLELGRYMQPGDAERAYIVPSYRPGALIRKASTKAGKQIGGQFLASAMLAHMQKVARLAHEDPIFDLDWHTVTDPVELGAYLARDGLMSCDIETNAKDPSEVTAITCIGFKLRTDGQTIVVATATKTEDGWAPHPLNHPLIAILREYLGGRHPGLRFLGQNFSYDIAVIKRIWGIDVAGYASDTLIGHNAVAPDEPHDLAHISGVYTDAAPWKPPKEVGGIQSFETVEELHRYNAKDVHITDAAMKGIEVDMAQQNVTQVHNLDIAKAKLGLSMGEFGMPIDRAEQLKVGAECQYAAEVALKKMRDMVGKLPLDVRPEAKAEHSEWLNPNSSKQLRWALYDPTGPYKLVAKRFTDESMKTPSADKSALLDYADHPFVAALLDFRNNTKTKSTFIDGMKLGADMRLHARWNPTGARTGRWSSSPNFQNWPKWIRTMVYALEGRMFVGADFSQLEMRILAALCGDEGLIAKCRDADESRKLEPEHDPHSYVAAMTFGNTFTDLSLNDPNHDSTNRKCACETCTRKGLRDIVKRTVYGLNYGAGSETVREAIYDGGYEGPPISIGMIDETAAGYFKAFPKVKTWRANMLRDAESTGIIRDMMSGRCRQFPLRDIDSTVAYNFPIQAAAATVMDLAAIKLHERLSSVDPTAKIFALVHDAAYVECAEERAVDVANLVEECLSCQIRMTDTAEWMPLPAAAAIAKDWKKAG